MGKYSYSSDINDKIDNLCKDCATTIMLDFPSVSLDVIEDTLKKITHFIKDNFDNLGSKDYLLDIDFDDQSLGTILSSDLIIDEIKSSKNLFIVNSNLNVLNVDRLEYFSVPSIANYSKINKCVCVFIHNGIDFTVYSLGVPFEQRNIHHPTGLPVLNNRFNRPAQDYKISLIEFYKEKVRTNVTDHWNDPSKRILNGGQTEEIFLLRLVQWFNDHLNAKINFKVNKISKDETDIEIIKHGGESYLLELKWLGRNEKTTYGVGRLLDAFDQVENYLEYELDVLEATLVVYDGRALSDYTALKYIREESGNWKEIKECNAKCLSSRGSALIFYLISETASKRKIA